MFRILWFWKFKNPSRQNIFILPQRAVKNRVFREKSKINSWDPLEDTPVRHCKVPRCDLSIVRNSKNHCFQQIKCKIMSVRAKNQQFWIVFSKTLQYEGHTPWNPNDKAKFKTSNFAVKLLFYQGLNKIYFSCSRWAISFPKSTC